MIEMTFERFVKFAKYGFVECGDDFEAIAKRYYDRSSDKIHQGLEDLNKIANRIINSSSPLISFYIEMQKIWNGLIDPILIAFLLKELNRKIFYFSSFGREDSIINYMWLKPTTMFHKIAFESKNSKMSLELLLKKYNLDDKIRINIPFQVGYAKDGYMQTLTCNHSFEFESLYENMAIFSNYGIAFYPDMLVCNMDDTTKRTINVIDGMAIINGAGLDYFPLKKEKIKRLNEYSFDTNFELSDEDYDLAYEITKRDDLVSWHVYNNYKEWRIKNDLI